MNKQILEQLGVTESEYRNWCDENNKPHYRREVKTEFFAKVYKGTLVKDSSGKIVKKRRR